MTLLDALQTQIRAEGINVFLSYNYPLPESIIAQEIAANDYCIVIYGASVMSESIISKSTGSDIEKVAMQIAVYSKSDKLSYDTLYDTIKTLGYETEQGNFGKPASRRWAVGTLYFHDIALFGGQFDPAYFDESKYKGCAQAVIITVEQ